MKKTLYFLFAIAAVALTAGCNYNGDHQHAGDASHGGDHNADEMGVHDGKHEGAVKPASSTGNFGEIISSEQALPAEELPVLLEGREKIEVKLEGEVMAVCQATGCWMDLDIGDGEIVHVTFKDDGFLMPKDAAGKTAVIEGMATYEEIPVNMLKHLAEDEGRPQEEIDAITDPKMEYTFVAKGVILQENLY